MEVINGHSCFYIHRVNNEGADTVIFMNGVLNSAYSWKAEAQLAKELGLNTLRYDYRGLWMSEVTDGPYTFELLAQDLGVLMDNCNIERAHLVGISYGCFIAQKFAAMFPERAESLLLMNTTPVLNAKQRFTLETWSKLNKLDEPILYLESMFPFLYCDAFFESAQDKLDEARQFLYAGVEHVPTFSYGQYQLNQTAINELAGDGLIPDAKQIKCPTHVVTSEFDALYPPQYSELLAELIEGSELTVLPKLGHAITREAPKLAMELIHSHLVKYCS
ncbi:MAG: alpha/beta hydrolase [Gammaproteobacteria bacterium]|mgnify:CR=1 FL=1|nr:MAG: alpha/beta hydrolase [Gammaproteobacteria bacterium]